MANIRDKVFIIKAVPVFEKQDDVLGIIVFLKCNTPDGIVSLSQRIFWMGYFSEIKRSLKLFDMQQVYKKYENILEKNNTDNFKELYGTIPTSTVNEMRNVALKYIHDNIMLIKEEM